MPEVIVIGGANVDIKGRSRAAVMPGTSNPGEVIVSPGGVGRNIAENLARLDVSTALLAMTGDDAVIAVHQNRVCPAEFADAGGNLRYLLV